MKRYPLAVLFIVLGLLVTACVAPMPAGGGATGAEQEAEMEAAEMQTLRYGMIQAMKTFDPAREGGFGRFIMQHVWLPPFIADPNANLTPGTCTSYDVSEDGMTYTLHVNPEVKWSDGSQFTAGDIKAWFEYIVNPENTAGWVPPNYGGIVGYDAVREGTATEMEGLVIVDEFTLEISLKENDPLFVYKVLANYNSATAKAEEAWADLNGEWWANDPLVNGPYTIESWDDDVMSYVYVPNPNYWGENKATLRIEVTSVLAEETLSLMYENDQFDIVIFTGAAGDALSLKYPGDVVPMNYKYSNVWGFNPNLAPMDDPLVRRALIHAIDHERIVQVIYGDTKDPAAGPIYPGLTGHQPDIFEMAGALQYDPELAKQELAQSTYGSAENLPKLNLALGTPDAEWVRGMEMILEMWRDTLGITDVETKPWWNDWAQGAARADVVHMGGFGWGTLPDAGHAVWRAAYTGNAMSRIRYSNPEVDALLDEAMSLSRTDPRFLELVHEAESLYLEDYVWKPFFVVSYAWHAKPWVQGLEGTWYNNWYNIEEVTVADH
jgi:oligopeptide transport system substrate-binding protein